MPTWNYLAVHAHGKVKLIEDEELKDHLKKPVYTYKDGRPNRVSVETMNVDYVAKQVKTLVGFEIMITEMHGSRKLKQNRDEVNHQNIVRNLEESRFPLDKEVAEEMRKDRSDYSRS